MQAGVCRLWRHSLSRQRPMWSLLTMKGLHLSCRKVPSEGLPQRHRATPTLRRCWETRRQPNQRPHSQTHHREDPRYAAATQCDKVRRTRSRRPPRRATGQAEMEWEEALLEAWGGEVAPHSADHYRRKAARARQLAEGVTTEAMKERLLDEAAHLDRLAADLRQ